MALTSGAFPYDLDNIVGGAKRILLAPVAEDKPTHPGDGFGQVAPYAAIADWFDAGGTKESFSYSRGFESEDWELQQSAGAVMKEVTDVSRSITFNTAEIAPKMLQIAEQQDAVATVAASANKGAQKVVKFGQFSALDRYRVMFVSMRKKTSGIVVEPGGATRGRFVAGVGYQCEVSADDIEIEWDKGVMTAFNLTFDFYPDSSVAAPDENYGGWFFEDAGTIAAT